jgi:hypothetical protein
MAQDEEIVVSPEVSEQYANFEEFCFENTGNELTYLEVVTKSPLEMDAVTLAFCLRHLVRLSRGLMDMLLESLKDDSQPALKDLLESKGIQLDKSQAVRLRDVIFAFRDNGDEESQRTLVTALQLMTISRERSRIVLNLGESYYPPDEGWTAEDFGDDESMLEAVRAIEDPHWTDTDEV